VAEVVVAVAGKEMATVLAAAQESPTAMVDEAASHSGSAARCRASW